MYATVDGLRAEERHKRDVEFRSYGTHVDNRVLGGWLKHIKQSSHEERNE